MIRLNENSYLSVPSILNQMCLFTVNETRSKAGKTILNINDNNSIYIFHFIFNIIFILFYGIFLISVFSYIIIFIFRFIVTIDCNKLCTYTRHRSLS